jgi:CheY-like chemotaxis protein
VIQPKRFIRQMQDDAVTRNSFRLLFETARDAPAPDVIFGALTASQRKYSRVFRVLTPYGANGDSTNKGHPKRPHKRLRETASAYKLNANASLFVEHKPPILVAEDEETDVLILRMAAEQAQLPHPLTFVFDGAQAIAYLQGDPPYNDRTVHPLPSLLLLDLKMPHLNGFDVLAWLSNRPDFKHLPAVVLSSSSQQSDIAKARQLGALDYYIKPHRMSDLIKILKTIENSWLPK